MSPSRTLESRTGINHFRNLPAPVLDRVLLGGESLAIDYCDQAPGSDPDDPYRWAVAVLLPAGVYDELVQARALAEARVAAADEATRFRTEAAVAFDRACSR